MLLDTCAVQHLHLVWSWQPKAKSGCWARSEMAGIRARYGTRLGEEFLALYDLVKCGYFDFDGHPWVVSQRSLKEIERTQGDKGNALRAWWQSWADHWNAYLDAYPGEEAWPGVDIRRLLRPEATVHAHQLSLPLGISESWTVAGLERLPDVGDRALVCDARRSGVRAILTTDIRSFWNHRHAVFALGIEIWRPTDVWEAYFGDARRRPDVYLVHPADHLPSPRNWLPTAA
jgi:hypothetical protein